MKSEPTTAIATPQTTPRISSIVDATVLGSERPQEPVLMHLSPPVLHQVSEPSKTYANPLVRVCTGNNPPEGEGRSKSRGSNGVPLPAHIPKPKASSDPNVPESAHPHTHLVPEVREISKPCEYTINSEVEKVSVIGRAQTSPWISRLHVFWDNYVRNLTLNPFRKTYLAEKAGGCDKSNQPPQSPQLQAYSMEEQPSQECVASRIWWDLPMTGRIRNRSSLSSSSNSSNQNDSVISDKMMDFQQTRIYGFGQNIGTDVNADGTAGTSHSTCLMKSLGNSGNNKVPQLPATGICKNREHRREQRLPLVHEVQQNRVDGVSRGSTIAHSSAACVVTLNQEEPTELKISEQPWNNVHEVSNTMTGIEAEQYKPAGIRDDCWVHQWLASYSVEG